jgi:tetrahydromethanopterin:alpha-L-glutamate ligase
LRIAILVDAPEWHARTLIDAFAKLGVEAAALRLADCAFNTTRKLGLDLPQFGGALPDAVLVRAIGGGSFEEVTRRLGILHALQALRVPVWNDACAIERCVDKSTASFLLARAGLPTPPTWAVEGLAAARAVAAQETREGPLVLKPLFGAQGRGLLLIQGWNDLPDPETVNGVYYLQRYIPAGSGGFRDYRLLVCGDEVIAGMTRHSSSWITNIGRGGRPERLLPDAGLRDLALRAAAAVGARYAGVDLVRRQDGEPQVLEVNSMPGWKGLQHVTPIAIADRIAAALIAAVG